MTSPRPSVSIGLPVFNGERFLRAAIESILDQEHGDFELILADNASTDATPEICREYVERDARVQYHRSPENLGAAANYNRLVDLARAPFFRWATHDDLVAPSHLGRCLRAFEEGGDEVVLVYPKTSIIDLEGQVVDHYEDGAEALQRRAHQRLRVMLRNLSLVNAILGLVRTDVLRGTRRIGSWRSSDKTLMAELALRGLVVEVPERLYLRRRDPSLSSPSNLSPEAQAAWFDTQRAQNRGLRTGLVKHAFAAVQRAPLDFGERLRCHLTVARDAVRWRRQLLSELLGRERPPRRARSESSVTSSGRSEP